MLNIKFHLILLVETWLDKNIDNDFELPSYTSYDIFRHSHGGGIKLYVDCSFQSAKIDNLCSVNNCFESLFVNIKISSNTNVTIGCIYRIPSTSITEFNEIFFENYLHQVIQNKTIILGDLNINLYDRDSNPTNEYLNNFLSLNFSPLIYYPTRVNPEDVTRYSLLDHIFTNIHDSSTLSAVLEYQLTDHFPIAGFIPVNISNKCKTKTFYVRPINNRKTRKFCESLNEFVNNFRFEDHMSPNENFTAFTNSLYQIYYDCFPLKEINKQKCTPWITREIRECIHKKSTLYKLFRRGRIPKSHYRNYCNLLTSTIRKIKNNYYKCYFQTNRNDQRKIFAMINTIKNKIKSDATQSILINGTEVTDKKTISNAFNRFFIDIAANLKNNIPPANSDFNNNIDRKTASFFMEPISERCIVNIIKRFKNKKCHPNEIPVCILKLAAPIIAAHLSRLINDCMEDGIYPAILKKARVVPLHKNGSKLLLNNYRPISVLSNINKIFETFIHTRMSSFISRHNILFDSQYGFRKKRSTTCAILRLMHLILKAMHEKEYAIAVFLDLTKAFDCVEHSILLCKLERYGFRGSFLSVIRSYLGSRMQHVDVGVTSDDLTVAHGVPQGSVLGPLLFLLYINDINYIMPGISKIFFADDTVLLNSNKDLNILVDTINANLTVLADWMNFNKLVINANKTKCMLYSFRESNFSPYIKLNGVSLAFVKIFKYLGLQIDDQLSFKHHIACLTSRLAFYQGLIYSLKPYLSIEALKSVYYSCIFPHLLLHAIIWMGTAPTHINHVQIAQNKIMRTINNADYETTSDIYDRLNIINISEIYRLQCLIFMYNWLKCDKYPFLDDIRDEVTRPPMYQTRHSQNLRLPFPRLNIHKQTVIYNGLKYWNGLDESIRSAPSLMSFKKRLKSRQN